MNPSNYPPVTTTVSTTSTTQEFIPTDSNGIPTLDGTTNEKGIFSFLQNRVNDVYNIPHTLQTNIGSANGQPFVVKVIEARSLRARDFNGYSDPFIEVKLKGSIHSQKGKVVKRTVNPIFNEEFTLKPGHPDKDIIVIRVYDHDSLSMNDFMGQVKLPVAQYLNRGYVDEWLPLTDKGAKSKHNCGQIHIVSRFGAVPQQQQQQPIVCPPPMIYAPTAVFPQPYYPQQYVAPQQYGAPPTVYGQQPTGYYCPPQQAPPSHPYYKY